MPLISKPFDPCSPGSPCSQTSEKSRRSKLCKKALPELQECIKDIPEPTMNQIKEYMSDMVDAVYYPEDRRLKWQNKWQDKPEDWPDNVKLYSPGNYIPGVQPKRKPRKDELLPAYSHLRDLILSMKLSKEDEEIKWEMEEEGLHIELEDRRCENVEKQTEAVIHVPEEQEESPVYVSQNQISTQMTTCTSGQQYNWKELFLSSNVIAQPTEPDIDAIDGASQEKILTHPSSASCFEPTRFSAYRLTEEENRMDDNITDMVLDMKRDYGNGQLIYASGQSYSADSDAPGNHFVAMDDHDATQNQFSSTSIPGIPTTVLPYNKSTDDLYQMEMEIDGAGDLLPLTGMGNNTIADDILKEAMEVAEIVETGKMLDYDKEYGNFFAFGEG